MSILRWSEARPHPDVFLGPTVSYGEQGANRGGDLRRKGLTEETKDQKNQRLWTKNHQTCEVLPETIPGLKVVP